MADDMLGGHVDDMEADMSKPIVSIRYSLILLVYSLHTVHVMHMSRGRFDYKVITMWYLCWQEAILYYESRLKIIADSFLTFLWLTAWDAELYFY